MESFADRIKQTSKAGLYLTHGIDEGKFCWQYIQVDRLKAKIFEESIKQKAKVDARNFGEIVVSGWGQEPPELVKRKIEEQGAAYKADEDAELEAYYKSQSQVFFVTANADGRNCYYYVAVHGRMIEEFTRQLPEKNLNLASFGNIIESGWGMPTLTVQAYMKEKYGVITPQTEEAV